MLKEQKKNRATILWVGLIGIGLLLISAAFMISNFKSGSSFAVSTLQSQYSTIPVKVNYPAPEINLTDINSNEVSLTQYSDEIILVNNWATWCPPCKAEMPTLLAYYEEHKGEDFVVIAIESGEAVDEVSEFAAKYGLTFPIWIDRKGAALDAFANWSLPSSYVIDKSGVVRLTWTGEISLEMLEKYVTPLLNN